MSTLSLRLPESVHHGAREYARRMPAFRVLVNTPTPQGSTGITTNVFPAMTLGCGAMAGNATGDNVSPLHLINTKRLAWAVRKPEEAFPPRPTDLETKPTQISMPTNLDKTTVAAAVERYLAGRGLSESPAPASNVASIVDRFLAGRALPEAPKAADPKPAELPLSLPPSPPPPAPPKLELTDFVCENDVRQAIHHGKKIYIGKKSIVTPSARDLGIQYDVLVVAER